MARTDDAAQILETDAPAPSPRIAASHVHPRRLVTTAFLVALLLLIAMAALSYVGMEQSADRTRWVDHTYQVIIVTDDLLQDQTDAGSVIRGYLLTGDRDFLATYSEARSRAEHDLQDLKGLTADNPVQQRNIAGLTALMEQRMALLDEMAATDGTKLDAPGKHKVTASHELMDRIRGLMGEMRAEESRLLSARNAETAATQHWLQLVIAAGDLLSFGTLVICLLLLNREIRSRRTAEAVVQGLNDTLEERAALLEHANKELEGFSYSISHDLRGPLRAIDGFSQLLEQGYKGVLDAEGMRLLGVVRQNTRRMNALIEDLLAFSRLGRKSLDMMPLDMRQLVQEALSEVLAEAEGRPEVITSTLPSCLGDRALVKQVWINLISNAVKYSSKAAAPRVEISGREEGEQVIYTVRDNGVGFDMQYYGKLFGVFQRLHGVDEFSGTGVGLAIVMRVVTRHGGHAWAESAPGEGAVFNFSLPRRESVHE